jgi:Alkylmercury lyase
MSSRVNVWTARYDRGMDALDLELRNLTYRYVVDAGRVPTPTELAAVARIDEAGVVAGWRRLHDAHAIVLDDHGALRMLNPFSAVPTMFRVHVDERSWFANCGWDAFGIGAALGVDSIIDTQCADCHEPLRIPVRNRRPDRSDLIWHVLVPAREWWQDIGYT